MRNCSYLYLLLFLCFFYPAGCGCSGEDGNYGEPCLPGDLCRDHLVCIEGVCISIWDEYGGLNQSCYPNNTCNSPYICVDEICVEDYHGPGGLNRPCRSDGTCNYPYECLEGICRDLSGEQGYLDGPCYPDNTCNYPYACREGYCVHSSGEQGGSGGPCYPNGTCNEGLVCKEGLCVESHGQEGEYGGPCLPDGTCDEPWECMEGICLSDEGENGRCIPGDTVFCMCDDIPGYAVCNEDGLSYSECDCSDLQCNASQLSVRGSVNISTSENNPDFTGSFVEAELFHVPRSDGGDSCVGSIRLVIHHPALGTARGCRMELEFGTADNAGSFGGIINAAFFADAYCPGIPESSWGFFSRNEYSEGGWLPAWYNGPPPTGNEESCIGYVQFVFPDNNYYFESEDGQTIGINLSGLEIYGILFSRSDPGLDCVEIGCPEDRHNGGDGWCLPQDTCSPGYHDGGDGICIDVADGCAEDFRDGGDGYCVPEGECSEGFIDDGSGCVPEEEESINCPPCTYPGEGYICEFGCLSDEHCPEGLYCGSDGFCAGDGSGEFRGLWITRWNYSSEEDVENIFATAAGAGFNAVFFQVRGQGDAYYQSQHEPWADIGGAGFGQDPGWDPLDAAISYGAQYGLKVHAWINVIPAWMGSSPPPESIPRHRVLSNPEWLMVDSGGRRQQVGDSGYIAFSPGILEVQDHLINVIKDILDNYPVDGLHLDYIRYIGQQFSHDPVSNTRFNAARQDDPSLSRADWQREQINEIVRRAYIEVSGRGGMILSAASWHNNNLDVAGSSGYRDYYQDAHAWLDRKTVDVLVPMNYHRLDTNPPFGPMADDHISAAQASGRHLYMGIHALGRLSEPDNSGAHMQMNIDYSRQIGAQGVAIFAYSHLMEHGLWDFLEQEVFESPGPDAPLMPWVECPGP